MWKPLALAIASQALHLPCGAAADLEKDWAAVDAAIDAFKFLPDAAFSAGDLTGRRHTYAKGRTTMQTRALMASSSKFPAVVAIGGVINEGLISFDTLASDVFDWWTTDPADLRSRVRLSHFLGFVSGMVSDDYANAGIACLNHFWVQPEWCTRQIYDKGPWTAEPNTTWSYHSLHLQVAGAMAAKAAKMSVQAMLEKYVLHRVGMNHSFWFGSPNPQLAGSLISTGDDYERLMLSVLNYEILPKSILEVMERDSLSGGVKCAENAKDQQLVSTYGHYSMGLYFECVNQEWSDTCLRADIHADPGAFGYWPLIDRTKGWYMQIVTERHPTLSAELKKEYHLTDHDLAALPALCTYPLRFQVGEHVVKALGKHISGLPGPGRPNPLQFICDLLTASAAEDAEEAVLI